MADATICKATETLGDDDMYQCLSCAMERRLLEWADLIESNGPNNMDRWIVAAELRNRMTAPAETASTKGDVK